ncbi:MAG: hypothetical protein J0M34_01730 [Alphaproteobacteria bacterium]|nr:hypothetical protein [Alphaproteobacteria bacterium]
MTTQWYDKQGDDQFTLMTPAGHTIMGHIDYKDFRVTGKLLCQDGTVSELPPEVLLGIAHWKRATWIASNEMKAAAQRMAYVKEIEASLGNAKETLARSGTEPYVREAQRSELLARQLFTQGEHLRESALNAVDTMVSVH